MLLDGGALVLEMPTTKVLLLLEADTGPHRGNKATEHRNIVGKNKSHLMYSRSSGSNHSLLPADGEVEVLQNKSK